MNTASLVMDVREWFSFKQTRLESAPRKAHVTWNSVLVLAGHPVCEMHPKDSKRKRAVCHTGISKSLFKTCLPELAAALHAEHPS